MLVLSKELQLALSWEPNDRPSIEELQWTANQRMLGRPALEKSKDGVC